MERLTSFVRSQEEPTNPVTKRVKRHGFAGHGHACGHEHNAHRHQNHDHSHSHHGHRHSHQRSITPRPGKPNIQSKLMLSNFAIIGGPNRDSLPDNSQIQESQSQSLLAWRNEHDPLPEWHWPSFKTRGSTVRETQDKRMAMFMHNKSWTSDAQEKNDYSYLAGGIPESQCLPHETDL